MSTATSAAGTYGHPGFWGQLVAALTHQYLAHPTGFCGQVDCPPGWNWRPRLTDYDLWFVVKGRGQLRLDGGETFDVQGGTLLVLRPGDSGVAVQDPSDRLTVVFLHFGFMSPVEGVSVDVPASLLPSRFVGFDSTASLESMLLRVIRLLDSHLPLADIEARLILQQALLEIYRQDASNHASPIPRPDPRLERVISHLNRAPQARLSLDEAAEMAHLSPDYFSRRFTEEVGTSFREYGLRVRMERARYLLEETDMQVGQVAIALGYHDVFLFSRQFRKYFGTSPTYFRNTVSNTHV